MKTIDDGRKDGVKKRGPRMICRADVARELDLRDQLVAAAERKASKRLAQERRWMTRRDRRRALVARLLGRGAR